LHHQNKINNVGKGYKKLLNIIKEVSGKQANTFTINQVRDNSDDNLITAMDEIGNVFYKYFTNVGAITIENNIKSTGFNFKSFDYHLNSK